MRKLNRVETNIARIEKLIAEIKKDLLDIRTDSQKIKKAKKKSKEIIPPDPDLKANFEKLYHYFMQSKYDDIDEFIKDKSKKYLTAFCKAINLPISASNASKKVISEEVLNWLSQRRAITKSTH